jgi:hypothetical protein
MFCLTRKIIFTHPPKCGGTSFEHFLGFENHGEHAFLYKHASLIDHVKAIKKTSNNPNDFIKISIIRNPWDRMVSWYFHLKQKALLAEKNNKPKNQIQNAVLSLGFNEFIEYIDKFEIKIFCRDFSYYMFGETESLEIDFIIRHENYQNDFLKCLEILKAPQINLDCIPKKNQTIGRISDYKTYYSLNSKKIISNIYSKDIDFFKYSF